MATRHVGLRPIVNQLNLPTVLKTAILPNERMERLFIATQVGEIFYVGDQYLERFLDIRSKVIELGSSTGGYDERGLLGLAFHPQFTNNGLFYIHYSEAGSQGPGAKATRFLPDPCNPASLQLQWTNRDVDYDHIDTIEEWKYQKDQQPRKIRTLLRIRRPFMNHNGVNCLNFSPETGKLIFDNGDGGSAFDPYNLSQNDLEIAGKAIEIDVSMNQNFDYTAIVTRFDEISLEVQRSLSLMAKGIRNSCGVAFQNINNQFIKYIGQVGQDAVESIYTFTSYEPIPVTQLTQQNNSNVDANLINLGWRGWEGDLPTTTQQNCTQQTDQTLFSLAYYDDTIAVATKRLIPLTSYYHDDNRPDSFMGNALTAIQPYMGTIIPGIQGRIIFTDFTKTTSNNVTPKGILACTPRRTDCKSNKHCELTVDYDFGSQEAHYVSLGSNFDQTRVFLGVYGSTQVAKRNLGTVFEIINAQ